MELVIEASGDVRAIYDDALLLSSVGNMSIKRASHVEPDHAGRWLADMSPVGGPTLGPFARRSDALAAEIDWLRRNWL